MTDDTANRRPTHTAYTVRDTKEAGKGFWVEIGAGWTNRDGSLSITLDAYPANGRLVIQERKESDGAGQGSPAV